MKKGLKTIVFDLGGVLIDFDINVCLEAFYKLGYPRDEKPVDPYRQNGIFLALEEGRVSAKEYFNEVNKKLPTPVSDQTIIDTLSSFLIGIPDYKLTMIRQLKEHGYQIYMLSNTNEIMFNHIRQNNFITQGLTIDDYFDKLYLSYQMKIAKPDAKIYEMMISDSCIVPSQALFIDDGAANIEAATKLGFETYCPAPREDFRNIFDSYRLLE